MHIHHNLAGKTIEAALTDGKQLILRATNGQEFRIEWLDGEPTLVGIDVRIVLSMASLGGSAARL